MISRQCYILEQAGAKETGQWILSALLIVRREEAALGKEGVTEEILTGNVTESAITRTAAIALPLDSKAWMRLWDRSELAA